MAWSRIILIFAVVVLVAGQYEIERKDAKAVAPEKEQTARSASPGREKGSFQVLSSMLERNRTEERRTNRRRGKDNLNKIWKMNRKSMKQDDNTMMNDNEGAIAINQKTLADNDTNSLAEKMKELRREGTATAYEAVNKNNYVPQVTGVYCSFENSSNGTLVDMCMWQWNLTTSSHRLGFNVVTAADIVHMNQTTRGLKFSGPKTDAEGNINGHFLYLPVDPTMENMVIKSPAFQGLWEFCKFQAFLHQSKMQNASIRLISESTTSEVQWILQEIAGNNDEMWIPFRFMIGKVQQPVRIIVEITRPVGVTLTRVLPHIAIDSIRMLECLPEPPVFNGQCHHTQLKCNILQKESCIKLQQVCDLVKDCDDGSDENQNCDKMPYGSYCNFEQDSCGFEDVPQPILKWSRHFGPTPTDKTGPNYDHTCGPPDLNPAPALPPLTPAHINFSLSQCVGYYYFVNMNVTGPNKVKADFASRAVMRTVIFNPPPKVHGNITSRYYNCCMIRFYYQQNGRNYGSLSVEVVELTARGNTTTSLWFSTKNKGENWFRASIFLPNITMRYFFQFKTRMGMRIYSDSAIDDFSMAPECFGLNIDPKELGDYNYYDPVFEEKTTPHPAFADKPYYRFTTCGATGRYGPTQAQCDAAYNSSGLTTRVLAAPLAGVQLWEVPEEGMYSIIAVGGGGGRGAGGAGGGHGAAARALLALHRRQRLYLLVGQQGVGACRKTLSAQDSEDCQWKQNDTSQLYTSKTHEVRNTHVNDGGGGGGGGTYVFTMNDDGKMIPLIIAGGGGGISVGVFRDDGSQHAKGLTDNPAESGYMYGPPGKTSGAGGGWVSRAGPVTPGLEAVRGAAAADGGAGGAACCAPGKCSTTPTSTGATPTTASSTGPTSSGATGGFGGGGGACVRGGGGGGWIGGNTNEGEGLHGGGGWSYIDQSRVVPDYSHVGIAARSQPGEVLIIPAIHDCGCDYRCVALNEYRSEVKCYCPGTWSEDGSKCVSSDKWDPILYLKVGGGISATVIITGLLCAAFFMYNSMQKSAEASQRQKRVLEQQVALQRLRAAPGGGGGGGGGRGGRGPAPLAMAFNPHYGADSFLPQGIDVRGLPQVARESLKLVKALGQGAFGEVYQGLYRHRTGDASEMPVAVKTLPELSTGQAESDFLMEAAIMAKFNHPNVIHLIGVCFDRHPRFIVLELLAGGDLKNFLRESRPKPERASALTMKDLLLCALDTCKGCRYLEAKRFIHRDIAARNCLLTSRGPGRVVKIADFGMARDIYRADYYKKGGKAMLPIKWMPPEAYIDGVFTTETDVWSFGVLLWEVFSLGVMPYTGCTNREVMDMVSGGGRLEKPYGCPQEIYRLMCECWNPDSEARPPFTAIFDRLQIFLQDPEIVSAPLPMGRSLIPQATDVQATANGPQRAAGDYLVPMAPRHSPPSNSSSTDQLVHHSKSPTETQDPQEEEDLRYQPLLKASQEYGNIPMTSVGGNGRCEAATAAGETKLSTKFLPSNSTDRLLSSAEVEDGDSDSEQENKPVVIWETSFTEMPKEKQIGPAVEKLISITPTSPKPPENALSLAIETDVVDKTNQKNSLVPERKTAPIASPDPPRINAWAAPPNDAQPPNLKPKPLCLDAAQLEQNLNALKKRSGSVNLTTMPTTMSMLPPYINVVTPNKRSEAKPIQIDPKKAVIHDLHSPENGDAKEVKKTTLKQSSSAASLLNGPMTDVPYADSDNSGSSNGKDNNNHNGPTNGKPNAVSGRANHTEATANKTSGGKSSKSKSSVSNGKDKKIFKQGSNVGDSEINC